MEIKELAYLDAVELHWHQKVKQNKKQRQQAFCGSVISSSNSGRHQNAVYAKKSLSIRNLLNFQPRQSKTPTADPVCSRCSAETDCI